jgi:hypothetical protein
MIYREANILPAFIGMTVLAKKIRTLANLLLELFRYLRDKDIIPVLRLGKISCQAVEKAQVVIDLFVFTLKIAGKFQSTILELRLH